MKKNLLLLGFMLVFVTGISANLFGQTSGDGDDAPKPPTIEEIELRDVGGATPPKPRSVVIAPAVRAWYCASEGAITLETSAPQGWLTIYLEDAKGTLLLQQVVGENTSPVTINLPSLLKGYYKLTIIGGTYNPIVLAGWFIVP